MAEAQTWLGSSGETVKRLDSSNGSNKTEEVATASARSALGGNEITATTVAQA